MTTEHPRVVSVSLSPKHSFSKTPAAEIRILADLGVEGDAHAGEQVQHLYRVRKNPNAPNLCQVHLISTEFLDELHTLGFPLQPGEIGENLAVRGINLLTLPVGALLRIGADVVLQITGLRDPCQKLNSLAPGLMKACIARGSDGSVVRKAGVMSLAVTSGTIRPGDPILIELPPGEPLKMGPV